MDDINARADDAVAQLQEDLDESRAMIEQRYEQGTEKFEVAMDDAQAHFDEQVEKVQGDCS